MPSNLPVTPEEKLEVEEIFASLLTIFGVGPIRDFECVRIDETTFPFEYDGDEEAEDRVLSILCSYLDLDEADFRLMFYAGSFEDPYQELAETPVEDLEPAEEDDEIEDTEPEEAEFAEAENEEDEYATSGTLASELIIRIGDISERRDPKGRYVIQIPNEVKTIFDLVHSITPQLVRHKIREKIGGELVDQGRGELAAIFFGFGLAMMIDESLQLRIYGRGDYRRFSFYPRQVLAYAFALYLYIQGVDLDSLEVTLDLDSRTLVSSSVDYLVATDDVLPVLRRVLSS